MRFEAQIILCSSCFTLRGLGDLLRFIEQLEENGVRNGKTAGDIRLRVAYPADAWNQDPNVVTEMATLFSRYSSWMWKVPNSTDIIVKILRGDVLPDAISLLSLAAGHDPLASFLVLNDGEAVPKTCEINVSSVGRRDIVVAGLSMNWPAFVDSVSDWFKWRSAKGRVLLLVGMGPLARLAQAADIYYPFEGVETRELKSTTPKRQMKSIELRSKAGDVIAVGTNAIKHSQSKTLNCIVAKGSTWRHVEDAIKKRLSEVATPALQAAGLA